MDEDSKQKLASVASATALDVLKNKKSNWDKKDLLALSEAFNKHKRWVYVLTVIFSLYAVTQLISLNLVGFALSGILLLACWQAIEATIRFDALSKSLACADSIIAIEKLKQYYFYTTIYLGVTILIFITGFVMFIPVLFFFIFL